MLKQKQKQFWQKCEKIVNSRVRSDDDDDNNTQAKILWGVIAISIVFWGGMIWIIYKIFA